MKTHNDDQLFERLHDITRLDDETIHELMTVVKNHQPIGPIKPPKAEKQNYELAFWLTVADKHLYNSEHLLTESQAQALAEAVKALVEYCQTPIFEGERGIDGRIVAPLSFDEEKVIAARKAMQNEHNGGE